MEYSMERIINELKAQRTGAKELFIELSFIKRNAEEDQPEPDTDVVLDFIGSLNQAISILENSSSASVKK